MPKYSEVGRQYMYPESVYADAISERAAEIVVQMDGQPGKVGDAIVRAKKIRSFIEAVPMLATCIFAPMCAILVMQLCISAKVGVTPLAAGMIGVGIFLVLFEALSLPYRNALDRQHREVLALEDAYGRCPVPKT